MCSGDLVRAEPQSLKALRELAESAARVGGALARESFGIPQKVKLKPDRSEVTEVDLAVERAIIAQLRARRPNDTFVGEEATEQPSQKARKPRSHQGKPKTETPATGGASGEIPNRPSSIVNRQSVCWVIDPLDGTRNYIRGLPLFACSVAALREGEPVAGAVYDPMQDVMYSAARGQGTQVDGRSVSLADVTSRPRSGSKAKLIVGIPSAQRPATRELVLHALERHVVRNFGSAALHLALTAVGRLDVVVSGNSKLWDIAAGWLLVTEAGGVVTSPDGGPVFPMDLSRYAGEETPILAGNPAAHAQLIQESKPEQRAKT